MTEELMPRLIVFAWLLAFSFALGFADAGGRVVADGAAGRVAVTE